MRMTNLLPFLFLLPVLITGCTTTIGATSIPLVPPNMEVREKYPLDVALVVPPDTLRINVLRELWVPCIGSHNLLIYSYGNTFRDIAAGALGQMFTTVDVMQFPPTGQKHDLVFELSMSELVFRAGCGFSRGTFYRASGSARLQDRDKRMIWQGDQESVTRTFILGWGDQTKANNDLGGLLADLVSKELNGVRSAPQFQQALANYRKTASEQTASAVPAKSAPSARTAPAVQAAPAAAAMDAESEEAYRSASETNTHAGYEAFLAKYPKSSLRPKALAAMAGLIKAGGSSSSEFKFFLKKYPDGAEHVPLDYCLDAIGPSGLTVMDIITQKKKGMGDRILVTKIKSSGGTYKDFSFDEILSLKKKGLSDEIIEAMMESTADAKGKAGK